MTLQSSTRLRVDRNVLYIDNDSILTSAGVTAGIGLCLHLLRKDLGAAVAHDIAREMVAAPHGDGGQAQDITRSLPTPRPPRSPAPASGP